VSLLEPAVFQFGGYLLDRNSGGLFRLDEHGRPVPLPLGSRALEVLCVLVERQGDLVSKQAIMDAVWPDTVVEENNLTVQISALRRVLDQGRTEGSCIQTVQGRGYRFVAPVLRQRGASRPLHASRPNGDPSDDLLGADTRSADEAAASSVPASAQAGLGNGVVSRRRGMRPAALLIAFCIAASALLFVALGHYGGFGGPTDRPRLSLVVLPFENLSGDAKDDYLAEAITDDLTSDLLLVPDAFVIARESAYTYKGKPTDVRKIGEELGVRYVLEGSVRRIENTLRVNVQLTSAESGAHLWSDRFDEQVTGLAAGQEQIVTRMRAGLGISLVEIEKARSLRERPSNPDAFDLILQARALYNQPPDVQRHLEAKALFERTLVLDPSSVSALTWVILCLIESADRDGWANLEAMQRTEQLVARANGIDPESRLTLGATFQWLRALGRCQEAIPVAEQLIQRFPNHALGYAYLGSCKLLTGHADEDLPLEDRAMRINPRDPNMFLRYWRKGVASLLLGRDADAITFLEQSIALQGDYGGSKGFIHRALAAAYARAGLMEQAKHSLAEADRSWPYDTIRSHVPDDPSSSVLADQIKRYQDGLRLAGERDHADEDADFRVPSDGVLHVRLPGRTPKDAPGVRTIRTADLVRFLAEGRPIVIDTMTNSRGQSLPGAVGLKYSGIGGSISDAAQDHLRRTLHELTAGDLDRPIIAVGWNSERFDGRNLALRLAALGYTQVYWYRGGREAWEVNAEPETGLTMRNW
jgi:adenylate cyclase